MIGFAPGVRGFVNRPQGSAFSPLQVPGVLAWYDPADLSTLFQDAAGTIPVQAAGDPVGLMLDKSGAGHHLTQSSAASRPVYETDGTRHWLGFDGSDDSFGTAPLPWDSAQALVLFGITKLSDASPACLFETSANANTYDGTLAFFAPNAQTEMGNLEFRTKANSIPAYLGLTGHPIATPVVLTGTADLTEGLASFFVDGSPVIEDRTVLGSGSFGSHPVYIGRRANTTLPFHGRFHGAVFGSVVPTSEERAALESWMMERLPPV